MINFVAVSFAVRSNSRTVVTTVITREINPIDTHYTHFRRNYNADSSVSVCDITYLFYSMMLSVQINIFSILPEAVFVSTIEYLNYRHFNIVKCIN